MRLAIRISHIGAVGLAAGFFLLPIAYLASVSFKTKDDVLTGAFLPTAPTLANWPGAFAAAPLAMYLANSVGIAVGAGLITVAITLPAVYAADRLGIGAKWLPHAVLASYVVPPIVALIPLFFLFRAAGLINTHAGLVLVQAFVNVPVAYWLLAPFVRRIPPEIEEAAALDGLGRFRTLIQIVLPVIAPGIVATLIIVVTLCYNEFLISSAFSFSDSTRTLPAAISLFQGDRLINFGQMAVASLSGVVPVYLLALIGQRWLVDGLAHGGLK